MNTIIKANYKTLQKASLLLSNLSNDILSDTSVSPYYSSVGSHIRHVLDFYDCILKPNETFDLTARCRNLEVESNCATALNYLEAIISKLLKLNVTDLNKEVIVLDDLGMGKDEVVYTYAALLSQANSHAIHHYAIINYILDSLNVSVDDEDFGFNPTTPKVFNFD